MHDKDRGGNSNPAWRHLPFHTLAVISPRASRWVLHPSGTYAVLEYSGINTLGEEVCGLVSGVNLLNCNHPLVLLLPRVQEGQLDVLGPCVKLGVVAQLNC